MPPIRPRRLRTGNHHRRPLRNTQLEYRYSRGLNSLQIGVQHGFQIEIMSSILSRGTISTNVTNLIMASYLPQLAMQRQQLLREARLLFTVNQTVFSPILHYYENCEYELCDILPADNVPHVYGEERNRTIDDLSDFTATQLTRFNKSQLTRSWNTKKK